MGQTGGRPGQATKRLKCTGDWGDTIRKLNSEASSELHNLERSTYKHIIYTDGD